MSRPDDLILADADIAALGALRIRLDRLRDAINRTNELCADYGLPLLETYPIGCVISEISTRIRQHCQATEAIRAQAIERMERVAA